MEGGCISAWTVQVHTSALTVACTPLLDARADEIAPLKGGYEATEGSAAAFAESCGGECREQDGL